MKLSYPLVAAMACTAVIGGGAAATAPASAAPTAAPHIQLPMFTGHRGTGCKYNVSVVVTDRTAPARLTVVDPYGRTVKRLKVRNERRTDDKRVVEADWIPAHPGNYRIAAVQNGVRKQTAVFPVTPGFNTGSLCTGT
ncbi:hypothetical protein GOARA_062_00680 [Gordonia araii NBRC 100433]|uniref:Secreted protein n=1 Tax=Gordonia araii NBRC 100433 TaxID=1073574 RepID=G7H4M5_9ACTN|nr:hypothetical protein [Gordonia araii]NNG96143.1 hypothetical protein [Gordonia araii NBRC 100433]GAB10800.1 hypothetical protein GOARA_062_00680 [Gordonia araii NBRC 100433]